jgi:hypothetical protein
VSSTNLTIMLRSLPSTAVNRDDTREGLTSRWPSAQVSKGTKSGRLGAEGWSDGLFVCVISRR